MLRAEAQAGEHKGSAATVQENCFLFNMSDIIDLALPKSVRRSPPNDKGQSVRTEA